MFAQPPFGSYLVCYDRLCLALSPDQTNEGFGLDFLGEAGESGCVFWFGLGS